MKGYNYLDLFSGAGGFHKGLTKAGFKFDEVYFSEIDKHAISVYKKQFPEAKHAGDVTTVRATDLPRGRWIVTFGFPCQDLSIAGKQRGFGGDRSILFYEATRIIRNLKPEIFIFENVKGLLSHDNGRTFEAVLREIADIGIYDCEWQLLNTKWFLPQNRERIYFVGHLRGSSRPKVFPIGESNRISKESQRETQNGKSSYCTTITTNYHKGVHACNETYIKVGTLRTHKDGSGQPMIQVPETTKKGYAEARIGDSINYSHPTSKTRRGRVGKGIAQTLDLGCQQAVAVLTETRTEEAKKIRSENMKNGKDYSSRRGKELVPRTDSNMNTLTAGQSKEHLIMTNNTNIRRLTPIECEFLQGFPRDWTAYGIDEKGETIAISDTQRYKMMGNAVTVNVVEEIGRRLLK